MTRTLDGGCLCGRVRYRVSGDPGGSAHCFCRMCQRASSAAFMSFFTVPRDAFSLLTGQLSHYASSPGVRRGFCPQCGSQMTWESETRDRIEIAVASLDDPDAVAPAYQIWTSSRPAALGDFDPSLPSYEREGPD